MALAFDDMDSPECLLGWMLANIVLLNVPYTLWVAFVDIAKHMLTAFHGPTIYNYPENDFKFIKKEMSFRERLVARAFIESTLHEVQRAVELRKLDKRPLDAVEQKMYKDFYELVQLRDELKRGPLKNRIYELN